MYGLDIFLFFGLYHATIFIFYSSIFIICAQSCWYSDF